MDNSSFGQAPAPITPSTATTTVTQDPNQQFAALELERGIKNGANWFYWIAGLTLVNTLLIVSGSETSFVLGLMFTLVVDALAKGIGGLGVGIGVVIDAFAIGFFILLGIFANKHHKWAFIVGMIVYAIDGVLALIGQSWLGVGIHVFALWSILIGFKKIQQLRDLREFGTMPAQG
jgi:hypothetical protein